jgi:hypothetical protein
MEPQIFNTHDTNHVKDSLSTEASTVLEAIYYSAETSNNLVDWKQPEQENLGSKVSSSGSSPSRSIENKLATMALFDQIVADYRVQLSLRNFTDDELIEVLFTHTEEALQYFKAMRADWFRKVHAKLEKPLIVMNLFGDTNISNSALIEKLHDRNQEALSEFHLVRSWWQKPEQSLLKDFVLLMKGQLKR